MAAVSEQRWHFNDDQMMNCPSRRDGIMPAEEEELRLKGAKLIRDLTRTIRL